MWLSRLKEKKEIKYPEVIHFCELYTLLSLFLSLNVYFTVEIICFDIHGVSFVDRLWHKTLLRCWREHTGINRPRDQTRALPRNNNKCYFVQGVKSPKILAEDQARHASVTFSVPSLLQKAQYYLRFWEIIYKKKWEWNRNQETNRNVVLCL